MNIASFDADFVRGFMRPPREERPTPFVEIDAHRLDRNIARMQAKASAAGVSLRPHIKTHKSVELARRQIAAGAIGVTASKPSEALVFVEAGVPSLTLAYPVVRSETLDAMLAAAKSRGTEIFTIAADAPGVCALGESALRHEMMLPVFVKVDVGLGRIGVPPKGPEAAALINQILAERRLEFAGLLSHAGHAYAASNSGDLMRIANDEARVLGDLAMRLREGGFDVARISVGATPTCVGAALPSGITEVRPGNYAFLDSTALRLGICTPDDLALSVVCRVVFNNERYTIVDAGSKVLSCDLGPHGTGAPGFGTAVAADPDLFVSAWSVDRLSEEHGFVRHDGRPPPVGTLVRIFPNHACSVVALAGACDLVAPDGSSGMLCVDSRGCVT